MVTSLHLTQSCIFMLCWCWKFIVPFAHHSISCLDAFAHGLSSAHNLLLSWLVFLIRFTSRVLSSRRLSLSCPPQRGNLPCFSEQCEMPVLLYLLHYIEWFPYPSYYWQDNKIFENQRIEKYAFFFLILQPKSTMVFNMR